VVEFCAEFDVLQNYTITTPGTPCSGLRKGWAGESADRVEGRGGMSQPEFDSLRLYFLPGFSAPFSLFFRFGVSDASTLFRRYIDVISGHDPHVNLP
jgi:hypothetical protein